ncbi:ATP-binding cassette domain-containing protein [Geitlerinema sp. P-1104]|uniref:ABC transporter ATP-binding protein n=1 Tax=Geitlerinema sp. P-1104 TaxID=2546230 RepID=UPI001476D2F7|nr:ATP-binding cassette domain-containing protein [Geitlerinema sp. P-1104]NMG59713.1 ATP-binding cassette domain-containing protein [Geitlerinema sp. P-1104]
MSLTLDRVSLAAASGRLTLLQEISLDLLWGDRLGLVGISGAGKSLLLRLLNRLQDPTAGTILWGDRPLGEIPILEVRRQIVLVPQESRLLGMTVIEAMAYPLKLRGVGAAEIQRRIDEWCDRLKIPSDWLPKTELQLSLGQRQWVAIARALVTQPQVLLLDEPTSALDVGRGEMLMEVLSTLTQERSMILVMANHELDLVRQFASQVLHLQGGRMVHYGPEAEMDWQQLHQQLISARQQADQDWNRFDS